MQTHQRAEGEHFLWGGDDFLWGGRLPLGGDERKRAFSAFVRALTL